MSRRVIRRSAGWLLFVLLVVLVAGPAIALAAAVAAVAAVWASSVRAPARVNLRVAVALMAAAPLVWLGTNWARLDTVSPELATASPWPGRVAAMALVFGSAGLIEQVLGSARHDEQ